MHFRIRSVPKYPKMTYWIEVYKSKLIPGNIYHPVFSRCLLYPGMVPGFRNLERNGLLLPSDVLYFNVRCVFRDVHSRYFTHGCLSIRLHQPGHSVSPLSLIKHIPQPLHKMPLTSCYFVSSLSSIESVVHENPRRPAVYTQPCVAL